MAGGFIKSLIPFAIAVDGDTKNLPTSAPKFIAIFIASWNAGANVLISNIRKGFTIAPIKVPIGIKIMFTASCINLSIAWNIGATFKALDIIPTNTLATPAPIKTLP